MSVATPEGAVGTTPTSLEEYEWEIPCDVPGLIRAAYYEWAGPVCKGDPARWGAIRGCCGAVTLLCDSCKREYQELTAAGAMHTCVLCEAPHSSYVSFEPLRRT